MSLGALLLADDERILLSRLLGPGDAHPEQPLFYYLAFAVVGLGFLITLTGLLGCWATCLYNRCATVSVRHFLFTIDRNYAVIIVPRSILYFCGLVKSQRANRSLDDSQRLLCSKTQRYLSKCILPCDCVLRLCTIGKLFIFLIIGQTLWYNTSICKLIYCTEYEFSKTRDQDLEFIFDSIHIYSNI